MFDRLTLDSSNSSIPPSSDPNRKKDSKENDENESDSNTPGGRERISGINNLDSTRDRCSHCGCSCGLTITIAPDAEGGVGASKNGKNGAKTCQAFILFFSGTLCC
jgi:hypothetical protein